MMRSTLLSLAACAVLGTTATAQIFTPGNIVVLRCGDPSLTLGSTAAPVFLDEWDTTTNTLVQSIEMPNSLTGASPSFSQRGFSSSEGNLTLSQNGRYLVLAGYDRDIGASDPRAESSGTTPRVIATVDTLTGIIDMSTALIDAYDASAPRGAASVDGTQFWMAGNSTNGSMRYATLGAVISQDIATNPTNMRWVDIFNGQLYATSASTGASAQGILEIGTGLPTTVGQMAVLLPGFPNQSVFADGAPWDFWFATTDLVYVADGGFTGGTCGVQKWELINGTWIRAYTIQLPATDCVRGLTGVMRNGVAEIWFTAEPQGFVTSLYKVTDTGASAVPQLISTEAAETDYRGVRVIGTNYLSFPGGCGSSSIRARGPGLTGTDVVVDVDNASGFPFVNYSFAPLGLPLQNCSCTILFDLGVLVGGATSTLPIPNNASVIGSTISIQGIDLFDPNTTCTSPVPGLPFSTTDGISFSIF